MSRSLRNILFVCAVAVLAFASAACPQNSLSTQTPTVTPTPTGPGPGTDNDRPPIIIGDGTVHLRAVAKDRGRGTNQSRGGWVEVTNATPHYWVHQHGGPAPMNLIVNVIGGTGTGNNATCAGVDSEFIVRSFTVTYANATGTETSFKMFIKAPNDTSAGDLAVESPASWDSNFPFWLDVGAAGDKLKSVAFPSLGITCGLGPKREIHVYQTTKF